MQEFKINEKKAKEFGEYIRGIREKLGYSTNKVEIDTGISKSDLSRIENGLRKNINPFYLKSLAKLYRKNVLEFHKKLDFIDDETTMNEIPKDENSMILPIYGFASAGKGYINFDEEVKEIVLPKLNNKISKNSFCTIVKGESMEPYYNDGDIIVVNPDYCMEIELLNKKECVIDYDGERYLKRLLFDNGDLILRSYNEAYKDITVPNERLNEVSCCGVVTMVLDMRV
ncbi:XRE family transcriptional regulator [Sebaldella sp. S0638]|uniref:XRE family transcriptional regulator n=1 Tax=Sebaldella sp. S0638 TaxID=2957809 RepID=UPI00209E2A48|nr:XRE family transcriptional regulator [Sebaldella sp. S0638]MCP1226603.1 XRE family transcriptional regulator [Sebaldella sp. S0638]